MQVIKEGVNKQLLIDALDFFENGNTLDEYDFNSNAEYNEYLRLIKYTPEQFFEEFENVLDFSEEFIDSIYENEYPGEYRDSVSDYESGTKPIDK